MTEQSRGKTTPERIRQIAFTVITVLIAAVLLYLAFSGVDWNNLFATLKNADLRWIAVSFFLLAISYFMRSLRWRVLLQVETGISPITVFMATCLGYLGNAFLPARMGELVRTFAIRRATPLDTIFILTTALTERVIDAAFLAVVSLIILAQLENTPDWLQSASQVMAILGFSALFVMLMMPRLRSFFAGIIDRFPVRESIKERLHNLLQSLTNAMELLQQPSRAAKFGAYTLALWSIDVITAFCVGKSFGITLAVPVIILWLAALGLASAAPSTPGYVGIYQFVSVTVLTPFGISQDHALAIIIAFQGVIYAFLILIGIFAFWHINQAGQEKQKNQALDES